MLTSFLRMYGKDFNARRAAKRLGLGADSFVEKGTKISRGKDKGKLHRASSLHMLLSEKERCDEHMDEVTVRIEQLLPFLLAARRESKGLEIFLSTGCTVGGQEYYTRAVRLPPSLITILAAAGVAVVVDAYPCSDG